jgi:dTDP-4-dehydro-6-deoxy-alpha-D-glucopyranose 2,3-dehydratase
MTQQAEAVGTVADGPVAPGRVVRTAAEFDLWWAERRRATRSDVTRIPFAALDSWSFDPVSGNLGHASGRFFSVEALQLDGDGDSAGRARPVIHQPEIGLLGVLVTEVDGVLHCLMQAKMEPGNVDALQLSPTVQATRSNYTRVHEGGGTRYLEYFRGRRRGGEVLVDVLQSEQGSWFWRKRNRNVVVRVRRDVPPHEDFRWVPLPLLRDLLRIDNLVNMDARTVLSCLADDGPGTPGPAVHTAREIRSWFIEAKTRCRWAPRLVPLAAAPGWVRTAEEIRDEEGRDFRIIAVRVAADSREVRSWSQPLLAPRGRGLAVFVARPIRGVPHLLAHAHAEAGLVDLVEIGPTVQLLPGHDAAEVDPCVRGVAEGSVGRVRFDAVLSEEGGRFHHALTRYRVVEVGEEFPVDVPPDYCWTTPRQLVALLRHGHYLNIEARTLLACLPRPW